MSTPSCGLSTATRSMSVPASGDTTRVRLLNVDAPETVDPSRPVGCLGPEASQRLTELLPVGSPVDLAFDVERTDRYGRTLAGVYAKGELVNARMASEGLAVPVTVGSNTRFRAEVDASWQAANDKRLGLFDPIAPCTAPGQVQTLRNDVADLAESSAPQQASDAAAAASVAKAVSDDASTLHKILLARTASEVAALPQPVLSSLTHEVAGLASRSAATYNALLKKEASLRAQEKARADAKARAEAQARAKARQRPGEGHGSSQGQGQGSGSRQGQGQGPRPGRGPCPSRGRGAPQRVRRRGRLLERRRFGRGLRLHGPTLLRAGRQDMAALLTSARPAAPRAQWPSREQLLDLRGGPSAVC